MFNTAVWQRNGNAMVFPAVNDENKKNNCWSVEEFVENVLRMQLTVLILGIRDTDYTRQA